MKLLYKILIWIAGICAGIYIAICCFLYFKQEKIIFPGSKIPVAYKFDFPGPFHEYTIKVADGNALSACLFTDPKSKGLIFYLHGNGGDLRSWGDVAKYYNALGYDVLILDYPGYGKSTGHLISTQQLFDVISTTYAFIRHKYPENHIVILGYSIGTGPAAWLASQNHPQKLILLAPYYSLTDMVQKYYPYLPGFILKYHINTYQYIPHITAPVIIFHGDIDEVIYYGFSLKLKHYFKFGDTLITLHNQNHQDIDQNPDYLKNLRRMLR
ncbi:MAG TPA: alpha/beta hydrolase [Mucilaginibacter sp.]|jgi:pimeloyl-ACP methyl ester carboxylesterase|nr:alpha/beta hydrolase [Mucilaginibacter sp.]